MLISIIVPIYNAEKNLRRCLDSIKNQTFKDIEVILVNDGSKDGSGKICDEYVQKDNRFKVIHKDNNGVSAARNDGLKIANGKYIGFVDADDWLEPNMFESLYDLIIKYNADIAMCGYVIERQDGSLINCPNESKIYKMSRYEALNNLTNFKGYLWNKLFSTELIKKNKIFFDEDVHFCEDLLFCSQAFLNSNTIVFDTKPYYHYIIHENSVTGYQFSTKKLTSLKAIEKIINLLDGEDNVKINKFKNFFMHMNISLLMHGINEKKCSKREKNKLKKNLFKFKINDLSDKSVKISCLLGRLSVNLLFIIWKIRRR